jgi:hypothetical protein
MSYFIKGGYFAKDKSGNVRAFRESGELLFEFSEMEWISLLTAMSVIPENIVTFKEFESLHKYGMSLFSVEKENIWKRILNRMKILGDKNVNKKPNKNIEAPPNINIDMG